MSGKLFAFRNAQPIGEIKKSGDRPRLWGFLKGAENRYNLSKFLDLNRKIFFARAKKNPVRIFTRGVLIAI